MNSNHRPADIEARLDAAIDALNAGRPVSGNGNLELTSLIATLRRARITAESDWPDADFPTRMARNLSAQLQTTPRQTARTDNGQLALPPTPEEHWGPFSSQAADPATLTEDEHRPSRRRQVAGIIAAAAAFSLLTFLLVTVFDAWRNPSAVYYENRGSIGEPRQIALVKDVEGEDINGQAEIFLIDDDGNNLTNLTNHPADDHAPAWSPDGESLAFVSNRTGRDQIYLMDSDGGNVRQLTRGDRPSKTPTWSPDGAKIAFIRQGDGVATLWIMAADGSDQRPLENASEGDPIKHRLTWSPDGQMLAYTYQSESLGIGVTSADGESSRLITLLGEAIDSVDWSANGEWLAIAPYTDTDNIGLLDAHNILDGSEIEPQPLTTGVDMFASQPRWAPDGSRLLFFGSAGSSPDAVEPGLYVTTVDGSFIEKIYASDSGATSSTSIQWLVRAEWSPTGHQIAFTRLGEPRRNPPSTGDTFELVVLNADGSDERVLADDIWAVWTDPPAWRPKPSDATAPPPTEVPQPDQTAVPIWDATPIPPAVIPPTPAGAPPTPTPFATDDFAAQVQAALDALPDGMTGCAATPGTLIEQGFAGDQGGTEYSGLALVGDKQLKALLVGVEGLTVQQAIGPSLTAMIQWQLDAESPENMQLDIRELGQGTTVEPSWGPDLPGGDWVDGTTQQTTISFPHAGCWQFVATQGDAAGVVWIDVPEEPLEIAEPTLTLDPAIGTCETTPILRGSGFEPGTQVSVFVGQARGDNPASLSDHPTVAVDGTFEAQLDPRPAITAACQSSQIPPGGLEYTVSVMTGTGPKPDGDDWRAPMGSVWYTLVADESSTSPEALDAAVLESAIETVRTFLDEPDAELIGEVVTTPTGDRQALLTRDIDAVPYPDEFAVDAQTGKLLRANVWSHTTFAASLDSIGAEEATAIAENAARRISPGFDQLTFVDAVEGGTVQGANGQEPVLTASWQLQTDRGVWLPTEIRVEVDLETGLIVGYFDMHYPYRGPLEPQITEEEARNIALADIAADPEIAGSSIRKIRLEIVSVVVETAPTASDPRGNIFEVTGTEEHFVWTAYLEDDGRPGGRRHIWVDAITGEILNPIGSANG